MSQNLSKSDELIIKQEKIKNLVTKGHNWFFIYFYSSICFISMLMALSILAFFRETNLQPSSYLLSSITLICLGIFHLKSYYSFLKEINSSYVRLKKKIKECSDQRFISGLISYINKIFYLLEYLANSKSNFEEQDPSKVIKDMKRLLIRNIVINAALGIALAVLFLITRFFESNYLFNPLFYLPFSGLVLSYIFVVFSSFKIREDVQNWINHYLVIVKWGTMLETE